MRQCRRFVKHEFKRLGGRSPEPILSILLTLFPRTGKLPLKTAEAVVPAETRRMDLNTYEPTFPIEIERQALFTALTGEITTFVFEDKEEVFVFDRNLRFVDDPLFKKGNEIVARFRYVNDLSLHKKAVIKDIDYDFPQNAHPRIRLKSYDKGFQLAGKENQQVCRSPPPRTPSTRRSPRPTA